MNGTDLLIKSTSLVWYSVQTLTPGPRLVRGPVAALLPVDQLHLEPRHGLAHGPCAHVFVLHHRAGAAALRETGQDGDRLDFMYSSMKKKLKFKFISLAN